MLLSSGNILLKVKLLFCLIRGHTLDNLDTILRQTLTGSAPVWGHENNDIFYCVATVSKYNMQAVLVFYFVLLLRLLLHMCIRSQLLRLLHMYQVSVLMCVTVLITHHRSHCQWSQQVTIIFTVTWCQVLRIQTVKFIVAKTTPVYNHQHTFENIKKIAFYI